MPIEAFSIENDGWFVIKVGCHYSTDLYTTTEQVWHECPNKSKSVALAQDKYAHLDDLGVPLGADVRIKVFVEMGPDQTSDETFTYAYGPGNNPGYCHGNYTIEGKVWNPILTYWGTVCESEPGKGDWWTSDLP